VPIVLQSGQALLFDQLLLHGGGANKESMAMYGLHLYLQDLGQLEKEGLVGYVQSRSWAQYTGATPC
jgi:ectoine hydroxylase-related dioxygenase (phytanoyl-CoA dioxygenase family)